jgi:site-specific DNA recombinase
MNKTSNKKQAVIYVRVSGEADTRTASLETQESACRKLAEEKGYLVTAVFTERQSGKKLWEREELTQARDMIKSRQAQALVVYDTDRLSRGGQAHTWLVVEEIYIHGAELLCVIEPFDNTPEGRLLMSVRAYRAEVERIKIAERTMRGRKDKLRQGLLPGTGNELYGYRKDKRTWTRHIYEPEAEIVRFIFTKIIEGHARGSIARELQERGVPTPSQSIGRKGAATMWQTFTITTIVRNPAYKGIDRAQVLMRDDRGKLVRNDPKNIVYLMNTAPAIVSEETWQAANTALAASAGSRERNQKHFVLLRGLVWCQKCGQKSFVKRCGKTGQLNLFYCSSRKRGEKCGAGGVSATWLANEVWGHFVKWLTHPESIEAARQEFQQNEAHKNTLLDDRDRIQARLDKIEERRRRLMKQLAQAEQADEELFEKELAALRIECESVLNTLAELDALIEQAERVIPSFPTLAKLTDEAKKRLPDLTDAQRRQVIEMAGLKVFQAGRSYTVKLPGYEGRK